MLEDMTAMAVTIGDTVEGRVLNDQGWEIVQMLVLDSADPEYQVGDTVGVLRDRLTVIG